MSNQALQSHLVERFGITPTEAKKMLDEAEAKAAIKKAVALASRGGVVEAKPNVNFDEQPGAWRHEVHRRLAALDVMEEGVKCLGHLLKHIKAVVDAEQELIQAKRAKVNNKQVDWWDLRDSGWAMGGRERFATYVGDIFHNLDEGQLGGKVADRMGFKRNIPLPDIPDPVEEPVPQDALQLEASLVRNASKRKTKAVRTPPSNETIEEWWEYMSHGGVQKTARLLKLTTPKLEQWNVRDWEKVIDHYVRTEWDDMGGWQRGRNV